MLRYALILPIFLAPTGCAALTIPKLSLPSFTSAPAQVGTPAWWKKHKKKAVFVPGHGYRVAGVEGYFDQDGRPIHAKVARQLKHKEGGLLGDLKLSSAVAEVKTQVGMGPDEQIAHAAFAKGEEFFRAEDYHEAVKQYKQTIARWPGTQLEQDAMFKLGESYFFAEKYPEANDAYEALLQKHANTPHLDKVIRRQFDIARYWEQHHNYQPHWVTTPNFFNKRRPLFDTLGHSIKNYENIRLNDPTGPLADDAIMATANSYFLRGRYVDADYHYDLLIKEYPRSEHQFEAHLLGLQSKLHRYEGPDYDKSSLEDAQRLAKQLRTQFGGELKDDQRQRLREIEGQIVQQIAEQEMNMAMYYDNKKEYGSAKTYYRRLAREYPDTKIGQRAVERLAALEGSPDRPEDPLDKVVSWFPESTEHSSIAQVPLLPEGNTLEGDPQIQMATRPQRTEGNGNDQPIQR